MGNGVLMAHQPHYFPSIQYFSRLLRSDVIVIQDDVQYEHGDWQNRNRIDTPNGIDYITVPAGRNSNTLIKDVTVNDLDWLDKHFRKLQQSYKRCPGWDIFYPYLREFYERIKKKHMLSPSYNLCRINLESLECVLDFLGESKDNIVLSSDFGFGKNYTNSSERNAHMCTYFNCDKYIAGNSANHYLDLSYFKRAGVKVKYDDWLAKPYSHKWSKEFVPNLSILDLIFNCDSISEVKEKI